MQVALAQFWLRQAGGGSFVKAFLVDIPKSYRCMEHADREQLVLLHWFKSSLSSLRSSNIWRSRSLIC